MRHYSRAFVSGLLALVIVMFHYSRASVSGLLF